MNHRALVSLTTLAALTAIGCDGDPIIVQPPAQAGVQQGGQTPPPQPPPAGAEVEEFPEIAAPTAPVACNTYEYRGTTYDCSTIDRCAPDVNAVSVLACAECYADNGYANWANSPCAEVCGDSRDNDGDSYADCDDQDCYGEAACPNNGEPPPPQPIEEAESCMGCHNGATTGNNYSGNGISNPHPFGSAANIRCTQCHGGDGTQRSKLGAHVPAPPEIGNRLNQINDPKAFFNRLTLTGLDKIGPYAANGAGKCPNDTCEGINFLQFVNPGDLRVVAEQRGCGAIGCHAGEHGDWVPRNHIATAAGFFSNTRFLYGSDNLIPEYNNYANEGNALADVSPRAVTNPAYTPNSRAIGEVGRLIEQPEYAQFNGPMQGNTAWDANTLANDIDNTDDDRPNRARTGSNLQKLIDEQVMITCGDCHLYSAGANNRYADFRSSGCTACHMQYSMDGRSRSTDPNVPKDEPANPDAIAAGERPHISDHIIRNVSKVTNGAVVRGITDNACVGCHQGSNRTVLQYWGIRLDQNQDLVNNFQYPANPNTFTNTANDRRLFDPAVNNQTFNGRNANQYILEEDYDGDGADDTPPDIHYEAGLGCIDCHGSRDLHGGSPGDPTSGRIMSRMDQSTTVKCENCHGSTEEYASTTDCTDYAGQAQTCASDRNGNALKHVTRDTNGNLWLISRVYGTRHFVPQTKDIVSRLTNKANPVTGNLLYSPKAAYAMGRVNGQLGSGPQQANPLLASQGFSHTDNLDCNACHAAWTNSCIGCHLRTEYDANPANFFFSNITGERILLKQAQADFVYQTPILTHLGINSKGYITQNDPAEKFFYRYTDLNGNNSQVFVGGDRLGEGNNPAKNGRNDFPAMPMNQLVAHSIRGRFQPGKAEGVRNCVTCHLTVDGMNNFGADYTDFVNLYNNNEFAAIEANGYFALMQEHIGQNTSNQLNSPFFVHGTTGLGTALFLFDANGCPINPLDNRADRADPNNNTNLCNSQSPADNFADNAFDTVAFDLDRIVQPDGQTNSSSSHPRLDTQAPYLRQGAPYRDGGNRMMAGPLNRELVEFLAHPTLGLILDAWVDADGNAQGNAADFIR